MRVPSYLVISPAKNEQEHIETTLQSIVAQTVKPARWIIVDDGSTDNTPAIVERFARSHDWISLVQMLKSPSRQIGAPVVRAFNAGLATANSDRFDFIVKLDCDLRIPSTYFEQLLARFERDPRLGIASGVYIEESNGVRAAVSMPEYHAAGACKVIRAQCFEEIGGFVVSRGWDTVDEIRAQTRGWRTCHFPDVTFDHLRPEGSARGPLYTSQVHGEIYYLTGGSFLFFLFKVTHRLVAGKPPVMSGLMLLAGYLKLMLERRERLVTRAEQRWYRRALRRRMWTTLTGTIVRFGLRPAGRQA